MDGLSPSHRSDWGDCSKSSPPVVNCQVDRVCAESLSTQLAAHTQAPGSSSFSSSIERFGAFAPFPEAPLSAWLDFRSGNVSCVTRPLNSMRASASSTILNAGTLSSPHCVTAGGATVDCREVSLSAQRGYQGQRGLPPQLGCSVLRQALQSRLRQTPLYHDMQARLRR